MKSALACRRTALTLSLLTIAWIPGASRSLEAAAPVIVVNPPSHPVPTIDVRDGTNVFQVSNNNSVGPGYQFSSHRSVPAAKRAVIEFVSIELSIPEGNSAVCTISAGVNPATYTAAVSHSLVLANQGPDGLRPGKVVFHAAQPIKIYADHSTVPGVHDLEVMCTFARNVDDAIFRWSASGYLVDAP
jgi:hypothetical protein